MDSSRLPKSSRLLRKKEFKTVFDTGAKLVGASFVVIASRRDLEEGAARLGVVVSKKVGCAVVRNKVKRQIREIFRRLELDFPADVVIIARKSARESKYEMLAQEICRSVRRLSERLGCEAYRGSFPQKKKLENVWRENHVGQSFGG